MKVVEIFNSIEGEGKRIGQPCTFIRLFGCNLRCSYCDSMYALEGTDYEDMSDVEIMDVVNSYNCPNVTLTGGEPLIHKGVQTLIKMLMRKGYEVNIETNGSIAPPIPSCARLFYTMDYKTNESGETDKMKMDNFKKLSRRDVVKFVVGSNDDLAQSLEFYEKLKEECETEPRIYVSPVWGKIEPVQIVNFIKEHKLWNWTTQIQLHKIIWSPDKKGV